MQLFVTSVLLTLAFLAPPGAANPSGYGYGRYYERQQYRRPFESTDMARDDEQPRENNWNDQIPQAMIIDDEDDDAYTSATLRTNTFTLKMSGMSNLKFDVHGYSYTSGQPWEGISSITCSSGSCVLTVKAGRHGSTRVANWFKAVVDDGSAIACDSDADWPNELNFGFRGTMSFDYRGNTYVGKEIAIAQGHHTARNNWWIGGPKMSSEKVPTQILGGEKRYANQYFTFGPASGYNLVSFLAEECVSHMDVIVE